MLTSGFENVDLSTLDDSEPNPRIRVLIVFFRRFSPLFNGRFALPFRALIEASGGFHRESRVEFPKKGAPLA